MKGGIDMRLKEIEWNDPEYPETHDPLQQVIYHGIEPIEVFLEVVEGKLENLGTDPVERNGSIFHPYKLFVVAQEIKAKIEDMKETLERFDDELRQERKASETPTSENPEA